MEKANLEKARSAAKQLNKMARAVGDYHTKIVALHKAHQQDMLACFGNLGKILGVEEADQYGAGEPQAQDIEARGTKNLQEFGKAKKVAPSSSSSSSSSSKVSKAAPAPSDSSSSTSTTTTTQPPAKKAVGEEAPLTKADVVAIFEDGINGFMKSFVELLSGDVKDGEGLEKAAAPSTRSAKKVADGVGDRTTLQTGMPVTVRSTPVLKVQDAAPQTAQPGAETFDVSKAIGGDQAEGLKLMRGAKPEGLPQTLIEPLSKIHR